MKGNAEMAALVVVLDGDAEFEIELGEAVGRLLRRRNAAIRDQEAADLLPYGWRTVVERFGVCKATAYNMAERAERARQSNENQAA